VFSTQSFLKRIILLLETALQKAGQSQERVLKRKRSILSNSKTSKQDAFLMKIRRNMFKSSSSTKSKN